MNKTNHVKFESTDYSFNKVFFGLFAVIYGLAFLINFTGLIYFNINLYLIWPLFIIFIGLSLFKKRDVISTSLGATVATICFALVIISFIPPVKINIDNISFIPVSVEKVEGIEKANININAGEGEVKVYSIDIGKLVNGEMQTNFAKIDMNSQVENSVQTVDVNMSGKNLLNGEALSGQLHVGIDKNTLVRLNINSEASNNDIDLSKVKAQSITITAGDSNINLTMGEGIDCVDSIIDAKGSSVNLNLPKTVGVKIYVEPGMSFQDLNGFTSLEENSYQSLNYESSKKRLVVNLKSGITSLTTNWYGPEEKVKVVLYYYNQLKDENNTCSFGFIEPIEREISASGDIIKQTVDLLIAGQLTKEEKLAGLKSESNSEFKLLKYNLSDSGTLTMEFTEIPGLTSGNSCNVGLMMQEILKTVRQFPQVKRIVFKPDSLFE